MGRTRSAGWFALALLLGVGGLRAHADGVALGVEADALLGSLANARKAGDIDALRNSLSRVAPLHNELQDAARRAGLQESAGALLASGRFAEVHAQAIEVLLGLDDAKGVYRQLSPRMPREVVGWATLAGLRTGTGQEIGNSGS